MTSKVNSRKAAVKRMQARARRRRSGSRLSTLSSRPFAGFTLVEMLVAVALVLLMMTLFAQIFQLAGGSVSTQRGIMENDQRARTAQILISGDLKLRSYRYVFPFALNEDTGDPNADVRLQKRQGYFYVSENGAANDTDDVLAFTVNTRIVTNSPDQLDYYGRAIPLWPDPLPVGGTPPQVPAAVPTQYRDDYFFRQNLNQPETDDARLDYNNSATSPAAEVCYFLRNGNLYRRVLLVRQSSAIAMTNHAVQQPHDETESPFLKRWYNQAQFGTTYRYPTNFSLGFDSSGNSLGTPANFWRHFDFSAHPGITDDGASPPQYYYDGVVFNGLASLDGPDSVPTFTYTASFVGSGEFRPPTNIAYPPNRFGHNTINPMPLSGGAPYKFPFGGQPREYGVTGGTAWWVGRLTMEETSDASVQYPMLTHVVPNSLSDPNNDFNTASLWEDADDDRVIDVYAGGPLRGEDLLLTNVHAFDVKVWDGVLAQFVDIGHSLTNPVTGARGDFHIDYVRNGVYGPAGASSRVFDTWYPFKTNDWNGNGVIDGSEPGGPDLIGQLLDFDSDGSVTLTDTVMPGDSVADGIADVGENVPPYRPRVAWPRVGISGSYNLPAAPNNNPTFFPRWVPNTAAGDPTWYSIGDRVFPPVEAAQFGDPFYYVCVGFNDQDMNGPSHSETASSVVWRQKAGLKTYDGELIWQAVDNRKPLRAIQITLRFIDPTTGQMRTLTLQHALVD